MAKKLGSFTAQVKGFADLSKDRMRRVMQASTQEVLELAQTTQPRASERGGPPEQGKIPVDHGVLRNSLASGLDGSVGQPSANSYVATIAGLEAGHVAHFEWAAEYALRVELGFVGTDALGRTYNQPGAHFVGANVAKWQQIVEKNAAKVNR